jgi:Streptomycin adenylyltransferase
MSERDEAWVANISAWANAQGDIKALVQIGSRVKNDGTADEWSDFDYQLITTNPARYRSGEFARELGRCWAIGLEHTFGDVMKVTAVFDGALEADFIILNHGDLLVATTALGWPGTSGLWPRPLRVGVSRLRGAAGTGWKVVKGGAAWEKRYSRLTPCEFPMSEREFKALCGEFWVQAVWAAKRTRRGELIASQRTIHRYVIEACLRMFEEEVLLDGKKAYPRGRRAETWLTASQAAVANAGTSPERESLLETLSHLSHEFARSSEAVGTGRGWPIGDYAEIRGWITSLS